VRVVLATHEGDLQKQPPPQEEEFRELLRIAKRIAGRRWLLLVRLFLILALVFCVTLLGTVSSRPVLAAISVVVLFAMLMSSGLTNLGSYRESARGEGDLQTSRELPRLAGSSQSENAAALRMQRNERAVVESGSTTGATESHPPRSFGQSQEVYANTLKADLDEYSRLLKEQRADILQLQNEKEALSGRQRAILEEGENLRESYLQLETTKNELEERCKQLENERDVFSIKNEQRQREVDSLQNDAEGLFTDLQRLQVERKQLLDENTDMRRQLDAYSQRFSSWAWNQSGAEIAEGPTLVGPAETHDNVEEASTEESSRKNQPDVLDPSGEAADEVESTADNSAAPQSDGQPTAPKSSPVRLDTASSARTDTAAAKAEMSPAGRYGFSRYEFEPTSSSPSPPGSEPAGQSVAVGSEDQVAAAISRAERLIHEGKSKGQATALGSAGQSQSFRCFKEAIEILEAEERNNPDNRDLVWQIGTSLLAWARTDPNSGYADEILEEACQRFMTLSQLDSQPDEGCFFNWGLALCIRAAQKTGDAALNLFNSACGKFDHAVKLNPESRISWFNYGLALFSAARLMEKNRRATRDVSATANYYREALAKFDRAVELEPSNWKARDYRRECQEALAWLEP